MGVFPLQWDGDIDRFQIDEDPAEGTNYNRGVHAKNPVTTPKWYNGKEDGGYRENLARMYIPLSPSDRVKFIQSVTTVSGGDMDSVRLAEALTDRGYMDFFLSSTTRMHTEKADVIEHNADGFVVYYFGAAATTYSFSGVVLNSAENDQAVNMLKIYKNIIRGTELARRRALVYLRYDSYLVGGTLQGFQDSLTADNELAMPFNFTMLVHKVIDRPRRGPESLAILRPTTAFDEENLLGKPSDTVAPLGHYEAAMAPPIRPTPAVPPTDTTPLTDAQKTAARLNAVPLEKSLYQLAEGEAQTASEAKTEAQNRRDAAKVRR
jgi:hypothetical protein